MRLQRVFNILAVASVMMTATAAYADTNAADNPLPGDVQVTQPITRPITRHTGKSHPNGVVTHKAKGRAHHVARKPGKAKHAVKSTQHGKRVKGAHNAVTQPAKVATQAKHHGPSAKKHGKPTRSATASHKKAAAKKIRHTHAARKAAHHKHKK